MWRMRSDRKKTAPLSTPDEQQVATLVVGGDLRAELAYAPGEVIWLDEDLPDGVVAHA